MIFGLLDLKGVQIGVPENEAQGYGLSNGGCSEGTVVPKDAVSEPIAGDEAGCGCGKSGNGGSLLVQEFDLELAGFGIEEEIGAGEIQGFCFDDGFGSRRFQG